MLKPVLPLLRCYRCGNTWAPRRPVVRACTRCKSRHWDEPKPTVPSFGGGLGIDEVLGPHRRDFERIARRYHVQSIRVFGSVARRTAKGDSDLDLLVDFDYLRPTKSTLRSIDLALELEKLLGRHVDVVTEESLHWFVQPQVIAEAVPL